DHAGEIEIVLIHGGARRRLDADPTRHRGRAIDPRLDRETRALGAPAVRGRIVDRALAQVLGLVEVLVEFREPSARIDETPHIRRVLIHADRRTFGLVADDEHVAATVQSEMEARALPDEEGPASRDVAFL